MKSFCVKTIFYILLVAQYQLVSSDLLIGRGDGSYPPHEILDENGSISGFHYELIDSVCRAENISYSYKSYPWKRALFMLENGEIDAVTMVGYSKEREKFAYLSDDNMLSTVRIILFSLNEKYNEIDYDGSLNSLVGYTISTVGSYLYSSEFDADTTLTKDSGAKNDLQVIRKVLLGRADLGIGKLSTILYFLKQERLLKEFSIYKEPLVSLPVHIAFSKKRGRTVLYKKFESGLKRFRSKHSYQTLLDKYSIVE